MPVDYGYPTQTDDAFNTDGDSASGGVSVADQPRDNGPSAGPSLTLDHGGGSLPPAPEPWSAADNLHLNRLNADLASLNSAVSQGDLYPEEITDQRDDILRERQDLLRRKQSSDFQTMQAQNTMALHANAQQQAVRQQDAQFDADSFTSRIKSHFDPVSGTVSNFFPTKDGQWQQATGADGGSSHFDQMLEALGGQGDQEGGPPEDAADSRGLDYLPIGGGLAIGTGPAVNTPAKSASSTEDPNKSLYIRNGPYEEIAHRNSEGQVIRTEYPRDAQGQEIKPPWARATEQTDGMVMSSGLKLGLSRQDMTAITEKARLMVPPPIMTNNQMHNQVAIAKYNHDLFRASSLLTADALRQRSALETTDARTKAAQAKLDQQFPVGSLDRMARDKGIRPVELNTMLRDEEKDLKTGGENVPTDFQWNGTTYSPSAPGGAPAQWKNMPTGAIHAEARRRLQTRLSGGDSTPGVSQGSQTPSAGAASQPTQPTAANQAPSQRPPVPTVKPLTEGQATTDDIKKELQKKLKDRELEKPSFNDKGQQIGPWFEGGVGGGIG